MNYFFITGTSKGLGKALAELLLENSNNIVYGFARTEAIKHLNYIHTTIDLSNLNQVQAYSFPELKDAEKITLVNNAGIVGDVAYIGKIDNKKIIDCYQLNLITPAILTNNFIAIYSNLQTEKMILNISSGAGRSPIDGWNVYCSSKAGLDMFSQVLKEETTINQSNITVLSLAPGIIDTNMQEQIRASDKSEFSNIERFLAYKNNGDLSSPKNTAQQVFRFIFEKKYTDNVLCSVRDLEV
jgi:benzil reductase ((S)-benzoin forming)